MEHRPAASSATQVVRRGPPATAAARRETSPQARDSGAAGVAPSFTLRLRPKKVVKWGEDVVDNEDMGKRKSKKCCIFHKRKKFGESSSESEGYSSGAESGSESPRQPRRALCTCDDGDDEKTAGAAPLRAGAKRGPFTQRRQEQEPQGSDVGGGASGAGFPQSDSWGLDGAEPSGTAGLGPRVHGLGIAGARGGGERAAPPQPPSSAASQSAEEGTAQPERRWDLLTDGAAVEQLQAENRPPPPEPAQGAAGSSASLGGSRA